ncbi:hypothetical protein Bca52824_087110 [Brassica carinata]|uniref:Uncharacterized protein n=1 Tax=Brassica carinata TaxID=52824 RepID=A0A8X7PBB1_BRACI|nr:hypothetical protein Bca52824_087110 [Brassica carinata]
MCNLKLKDNKLTGVRIESSGSRKPRMLRKSLSATDPPLASGIAGATREGAENPRVHNLEESDSEPEYDKETPEKISATESSMTTYLEQMFSKRFDAMQSMVERLPEVAPIRRSNQTPTPILPSWKESPRSRRLGIFPSPT